MKNSIVSILDSHYGKIEYCLNQSELLPEKTLEQPCLYKGMINGDNHGSQQNLRNLVIGKDSGATDGKYYLLLKGTTHSAVSVAFMEKPANSDADPSTYVMRNLKAGLAINDRIS